MSPITKQIEALSKISHAITSDLYLEDILRLIVSVTAQSMGSKVCSLMLLDEKHNYGKEIVKNSLIFYGAEAYYKIMFEAMKNGFTY